MLLALFVHQIWSKNSGKNVKVARSPLLLRVFQLSLGCTGPLGQGG